MINYFFLGYLMTVVNCVGYGGHTGTNLSRAAVCCCYHLPVVVLSLEQIVHITSHRFYRTKSSHFHLSRMPIKPRTSQSLH
jgi:hypothetical protein